MRFWRLFSIFAIFSVAPYGLAQAGSTTALTVTSSGSPVTAVRQANLVTLTATVTAVNGSPVSPGQVVFCDVQLPPARCTDIRLLATVQLSSAGTAVYKFFPGPGTHTYQAMFLGTHASIASSSLPATLTVTPYYPSTTVLSAQTIAGTYTLTATVTGTQGSTPPTGTVTFEDVTNGTYVLGTATLIPGAASPPAGLAFATSQVISTPSICLTALVADVNGDGKPDLVLGIVADGTFGVFVNTVEVLLGNGDGTFTPTPPIPVYLDVIALGVGDFNGDGKPDLVAFGVTPVYGGPVIPVNQLQVLLGNGDGTFAAGQVLPNPNINQQYPSLNAPPLGYGPPFPGFANPTIAVGDIDGDGIADIVFSSGVNQTAVVFFGKGDGTFTAGPTTFAGFSPDGIALGDFNGDGKPDLAITESPTGNTPDSIDILLGKGDGTFTPGTSIQGVSNTASAIVAADFNRDGILDLATEGYASPAEVSVFLGRGDGTFTQASRSPILGTANSGSVLAVGDFNGDGITDLITANGGTVLGLLLGNGDGTFQPVIDVNVPRFQVPAAISAVALGDFVGSGLSGIASADYANYEAAVLLPQATPQTTTSTAMLSGISLVGSGLHEVDAVYSGSSTYQPSTSPTILLYGQGQPTTVTLTLSPTTSSYGQPVNMTATVMPITAQGQNATGTITFQFASRILATVPLANGVATFTSSLLPIGTDTVAVIYSGDTNFDSNGGSTTEVVSGFNSSSVLTSTPNPSYAGQTVTITATVTGIGSAVVPAGTVTFYDSATVIGQGILNASGHATMTTSTLSLGLHDLSFVYSGDLGFYASTSPPVVQSVTAQGSATTLTVAPNPAGVGQQVTMTAGVTLSSSAPAAGTITFYDGPTLIGQTTLDPTGHATFTTTALALGTHSLNAVYPGSAGFGGSTSPAVTEEIEILGFTMSLSSPNITLQTYQHTTTTVTLTSLGNFADHITLTCGNLPAYVACIFTPNPEPLASNATAAVSFYLDTDSILGAAALPGPLDQQPSRRDGTLAFSALALLLMPFSFFAARRSPLAARLFLAILSVVALAGLSACGNIITRIPSAAPGTYTIPITAAAASGLTHTATLTLTVTP
jgi:hypothetical protein